MKKAILVLALSIGLLSFEDKPKAPKTYTIVLTEQGVNALFQVIEKSNDSHLAVEAIKEELIKQLKPQFAAADSTKKK